MGTLNPSIPSPEMSKALNATAKRMRAMGLPFLTPALLLLGFLRDSDTNAHALLSEWAAERNTRLEEMAVSTEALARSSPGVGADFHFLDEKKQPVPLSTEMLIVLDEGKSIAHASDEIYVGTEHALGALAERGVGTAALLRRYGITVDSMAARLATQVQSKRLTSRDLAARAAEGDAGPVYVRVDLMRDMLGLLALADRRHVLLIGDAGVGRRSLVHALALLMAEKKGPEDLKTLVQVGDLALLDDANGALEAALRQARDGILFVPNIERFFGSTYATPDFPKATRTVQRAFLGSRPVVIGTATDQAWNERLAGDVAISQNSQRLRVPEPSSEETVSILAVHKPYLEHEYRVQITDGALPAAASLGKRYIAGLPLPASALAVLHRASALLKLAGQSQSAFRPDLVPGSSLDDDDVAVAVSVMTGIPVSKLGVDERARYAHMVEAIHTRIINQEEAVLAVSRAVKIARVGLKDPKRPIGSFLFLGPTGVGKTELAKALADFMFGSEEAMVTLDMSEYQQDHTVNRLIGAPPGYVGFEGGGQLTEKMRTRPHTVVLFDEVEKAHPRVLDVLLQIMEEGRLTDAQGRLASFSEAVIILTSNVGSEHLDQPVMTDQMRERVMNLVGTAFRPEFLNRLDEIVLFVPLLTDQLRLILGLMLKKEAKLLREQGVTLEVSDPARSWLLAQNDHPEWGARPLRRLIQKHLREPLADWLLSSEARPGARILVDGAADGLKFAYQNGELAKP